MFLNTSLLVLYSRMINHLFRVQSREVHGMKNTTLRTEVTGLAEPEPCAAASTHEGGQEAMEFCLHRFQPLAGRICPVSHSPGTKRVVGVWSGPMVSWGHGRLGIVCGEIRLIPSKSLSHPRSLSLPGVQHLPGSVGVGKERFLNSCHGREALEAAGRPTAVLLMEQKAG